MEAIFDRVRGNKSDRPAEVGFYHNGKKYMHYSSLGRWESAFSRFSFWQILGIGFILFVVGFSFATNWHTTLVIVIAVLSVLYFLDLLFNFYLIYKSFATTQEIQVTKDEILARDAFEWPTYTIFCPLYKESKVLPQFIQAMSKLNYPKDKLDVLILLEEDDITTRNAVLEYKLPEYFRTLVVPDANPKTKPKALNWGLLHTNSEYLVIYDAEDVPDVDQLKKSVIAFSKTSPKTVCMQAKLNFYNPHQNILTKVFTAEYALWFDLVLTGLQSIHAPIPLGGTSNHFKTEFIKKIKGWDAFNVTEDADLGIRLAKRGYETAIIESITLEEANSNIFNWFWQRTRWIKGYIQTYFVHMRNPLSFFSKGPNKNILMVQLVIGGKVLSSMINPIMWTLTIIYFLMRAKYGAFIESFFPMPVLYIGVFSFIAGNFLYMYYYMIGSIKHGSFRVVRYVFFVPFYWLIMSLAAWVAAIDFIIQPHHWFKTKHGLHILKKPTELRPSVMSGFYNFLSAYGVFFTLLISTTVSVFGILYYFSKGQILAYGDAESHINISKRVIDSLTPGFGQLGGVWLPLQHIMMIPFVANDYLWRTGLGGSIVSAICFVVAAIFIFKTVRLVTGSVLASFIGFFVFISNPNILYLQSTPLGEVSLIVMMVVSTYFILKWVKSDSLLDLIFGAFFIFCGSLIRYDAWFFIICSVGILPLIAILKKYSYGKTESAMIAYGSIAFLGIFFWLGWNFLIFKNPLYFMLSPYSAKAQQLVWLKQGQLPSYHHIVSSVMFYTVTLIKNSGTVVTLLGTFGFILYTLSSLTNRQKIQNVLTLFLIASPYVFYVVTLYLGISIIFIPELIPKTFLSNLFNVRYGIMVLPALAIFIGLLWKMFPALLRPIILGLLIFQIVLFAKAGTPIIVLDGIQGLSSRRPPPVNTFVATHYDGGYVMFDDYSRTANPVSLNVPMEKIIYVGNHPYWDISLIHPTRYVRWFIIRHDENDILWTRLRYNKEFLNNYHTVDIFEKIYVYKRNGT